VKSLDANNMKKILVILFLLPNLAYAKSYVVDMKVCETHTKCTKCYETIKITYSVNPKLKQVIASGIDVSGKDVSETVDKCQISDEKNWICESAFITTQVSNGVVKVANKTNTSFSSSRKEVCLIK
jgi:hypothetical protein